MARKGPRPKPNHIKAVAGTARPDRMHDNVFDNLDADAELPAHFEKLRDARPVFAASVLEIWNDQSRRYRLRGQSMAGYSRPLYQMCLLEATILNKYTHGLDVPQAMINGLRIYYSEFHDTPAGNLTATRLKKDNPFLQNGKFT